MAGETLLAFQAGLAIALLGFADIAETVIVGHAMILQGAGVTTVQPIGSTLIWSTIDICTGHTGPRPIAKIHG